MTSDPIDAYLKELRRALNERGHEDARIVEEARDHLVDAVEDGLRRGLDRADAEREAVERFGAPDVIVAQALPPRSRTDRLMAALDTIVHHWRWIAAATMVAVLVTSAASYRLLPTRYRSETVIAIVPQAMSPEQKARLVPVNTSTGAARARLHSISRAILSRSRLDWIARDFGLDKRQEAPLDDAVQQMQRSLSVEVVGANRPEEFRVSYESPDPQLAQRITERIGRLFVEENLRDREAVVAGTSQSLDAEIEEVRHRLAELERTLETLRANEQRVLRADLIPFEVLQERYRTLLVRREDARSTANVERFAIGDQFRVLEPARLPDRPVGPSRASVNVAGALAGLMFSTVGLIWRRTS